MPLTVVVDLVEDEIGVGAFRSENKGTAFRERVGRQVMLNTRDVFCNMTEGQ